MVRLSSAYSQHKFLFLGGFLAPWSLAATFGIATDSHGPASQFLLVLTAPLLEWQTSQPTKAAGAAGAASTGTAAAPPSAGVAGEAAEADPKRARLHD